MLVLLNLPCLLLVFNHPEQPFSVQWMFINAPATERRVLRFFRLRWNATMIQFFLERDETGETPIAIYRRDATGPSLSRSSESVYMLKGLGFRF